MLNLLFPKTCTSFLGTVVSDPCVLLCCSKHLGLFFLLGEGENVDSKFENAIKYMVESKLHSNI